MDENSQKAIDKMNECKQNRKKKLCVNKNKYNLKLECMLRV